MPQPAPEPRNPFLPAEAVEGKAPGGPQAPGRGVAGDGIRLPELPEATIRPKPRTATEPLRYARIDHNEVTVFVECCADYVVVYPGRKVVTRSALTSGPLLAHVKKGLARPLLGGGTAKPQVRFLVRPEGERTFHEAVESLRAVKVPMTQYRVQPDDDVARLVGSR